MKYPIEPNTFQGFSIADFDLWVLTHKPTQIELSDRQYACLSNCVRACKKDYDGIPIVFEGGMNV